jgi:DNA-binding NarL/FixJ family response regulator
VNNAETVLAALQQKNLDMILARYARPSFNGIKAFRLLKQQGLRIPLIIFAETLDEAEVVESMKAGAEDYISRQNQSRLVALINRIKNQSK